MKHKLTKWFSTGVKPVHVGVYAVRKRNLGVGYAYFNGKIWGHLCWSVERAHNLEIVGNPHQDKEWRGLAEKP